MNKNFHFQILLNKNFITISSMIPTTFISPDRIRVWKNGMFQSGIGSGLERGLEKQTEYLMKELTVNTTR